MLEVLEINLKHPGRGASCQQTNDDYTRWGYFGQTYFVYYLTNLNIPNCDWDLTGKLGRIILFLVFEPAANLLTALAKNQVDSDLLAVSNYLDRDLLTGFMTEEGVDKGVILIQGNVIDIRDDITLA